MFYKEKIDHRNEKSKEEVEQEITVHDEIVFPINMLISLSIFLLLIMIC